VSLTLQVKDFDRLLPEADRSRVLETGTLTVGRGKQNDWVLPDPERIVSKRHCTIEATGGRYTLVDMSSNGVFLNRSDTPIGHGNSVVLKDGDVFRISHFEIEARVTEQRESAPADYGDTLRAETAAPLPDLPRGASEPESSLDEVLGISEDIEPGRAREPESGPLPDDDFFASEPGRESRSGEVGAEMEQGPLDQDFLQVPEPVPDAIPEIPDDWDQEWTPPEARAPQAQTEATPSWPGAEGARGPDEAPRPDHAADRAPPPPPEQRPAPRSQPPPARSTATQPSDQVAKEALEAFFAGAGVSGVDIPDAEVQQTLEMVGTLFREVVQGLMDVLAARSSIKSEFRLSQTIIKPVENNPLKFSLGVDDALIALLTKHGKGYLPPVDAIQEALDDIKAHQVAVLAGMQVALTSLLARFDPEALEQRINADSGIGTLLTGKKSRYWDEFTRLYENLAAEAEDDFQSVFGREFGRAYEEQARKQARRRG
jgi:type VI secretion system FHA domain protein